MNGKSRENMVNMSDRLIAYQTKNHILSWNISSKPKQWPKPYISPNHQPKNSKSMRQTQKSKDKTGFSWKKSGRYHRRSNVNPPNNKYRCSMSQAATGTIKRNKLRRSNKKTSELLATSSTQKLTPKIIRKKFKIKSRNIWA